MHQTFLIDKRNSFPFGISVSNITETRVLGFCFLCTTARVQNWRPELIAKTPGSAGGIPIRPGWGRR
jgi:hypothetical protein